MQTMDVFKQDAFGAITMSGFIDKVGYVPQFLGSIPGLFESVPVRTTSIFIEERGMDPALIQTDVRGAPPRQVGGDKRTVRAFATTRISQASRIMADQIQGVRAPGSETDLMTQQLEVARRQTKMRNNIELTLENMRLGCVAGGIVLDADGSTIINWGTQLEQTPIAEVGFDLSNASPARGVLRIASNNLRRSVVRALKGRGGANVTIMGICGDAFWDAFITHPEVRETYLQTQAAADLRGPQFGAFETFSFAGITYTNYRGTDDTTTLGINTDKCKFFPVGAGIFQVAWAPAERFEFVNTMGQPLYSWMVVDDDRDMWADVEMYSYPLHVCTMPSALSSARRGA